VRTIKGYKQLSLEEREQFYALLMQKKSLRFIAKQLNRLHSTLSREYQRNRPYARPYVPCIAENISYDRLHRQRSQARLKSSVIYHYVEDHLKQRWSPETIAGRLRIDHPGMSIHHETIYRYIYQEDGKGFHLRKFLTHVRYKRMKKFGRKVQHCKNIPDAVSIEKRPQEVVIREVIGHWETDNLEGKRYSDTSVVSTTVERVSRYTILTKLADKSADEKYRALIKRFQPLPKNIRRSITADNGGENADHKKITVTLSMPMYFCHPYSAWEKGSVENMNGRIRRYIPKGTSTDDVTDEQIANIEYQLNNTPRKCLEYQTPEEVMHQAIWGQTTWGLLSPEVRAYLSSR